MGFESIESPRTKRPDLHAFLVLDELQPGKRDIISAAEHDEFWLDIDCEKLAEVITEDQVRDLVRCGIRYDDENESLCMFA